jgi:hypothetical protein
MNDDTTCEGDHPEMKSGQSVFRAAASAAWINHEESRLEPPAYKLKLHKEEKSLSVGPSDGCTAAKYSTEAICGLNTVHGVAENDVTDICGLSLIVKQDEPYHAGICGLPSPQDTEEARIRAHEIAVKLSKQSRLAWTRPKKSK